MGEHRFKRTAEDAVQKTFADRLLAFLFREGGFVHIVATFASKGESFLFHQSPQEGAYGLSVPTELIDDFVRRKGGLTPKRFHHFPFGFGDAWYVAHIIYKCELLINYDCRSVCASKNVNFLRVGQYSRGHLASGIRDADAQRF